MDSSLLFLPVHGNLKWCFYTLFINVEFCDVIISSHNLLSLQRGTDQCDNIGQETERGPQWFNGQGHCG